MVWKLFLCRFRLVRELFSLNNPNSNQTMVINGKPSTTNGQQYQTRAKSTKVKPSKID